MVIGGARGEGNRSRPRSRRQGLSRGPGARSAIRFDACGLLRSRQSLQDPWLMVSDWPFGYYSRFEDEDDDEDENDWPSALRPPLPITNH